MLLGTALHVAATPPGRGATTLALRPEQLSLLPSDAPSDGRNVLPGRVTAALFLGNVVRCDVALSDTLLVNVETWPNDPLAMPGTPVQVAWQSTDGALLGVDPPRDDSSIGTGL